MAFVMTDKQFKEAQRIARAKADAETVRRRENKDANAQKSTEYWHKWQEAND